MIILDQSITLTRQDHQSHYNCAIRLPQTLTSLEIQFSYSPASDDSKQTTAAVIEELCACGYLVNQELLDKRLPVRNLITLSISHNNRYIGAHHCKDLTQILTFKPGQSPLGFSPLTQLNGILQLSFDCHAIVSQEVVLIIHIEGEQV